MMKHQVSTRERIICTIILSTIMALIFWIVVSRVPYPIKNPYHETPTLIENQHERVFWDYEKDSISGNIGKIDIISSDSMQLILMHQNKKGKEVGKPWCHGSVVSINEEDDTMRILSCKRCKEGIDGTFSEFVECHHMFGDHLQLDVGLYCLIYVMLAFAFFLGLFPGTEVCSYRFLLF